MWTHADVALRPRVCPPTLDLVIITAGHKQGLGAVEVDATHRALMLIKPVDQCAHAVVPQLRASCISVSAC